MNYTHAKRKHTRSRRGRTAPAGTSNCLKHIACHAPEKGDKFTVIVPAGTANGIAETRRTARIAAANVRNKWRGLLNRIIAI